MDNNTNTSKGFGFVTFEDASPIEAVQSKRPHIVDDKTIDTKRAMPREQLDKGSASEKKCFIGGLPKDVTEDSLKEYCETFGATESIYINRKGDKSDYAFVTFVDHDHCDKIILAQDHLFNGQPIQ